MNVDSTRPDWSPISTSRLRLDLIQSDRAEEWFIIRSHAETSRYQRWCPADVMEVYWFLHCFSSRARIRRGEWKQLGLFLNHDNRLAGDCGFVVNGNEAEIGYTLAPEHQHKGYGIEAVSVLINFLFSSRKVDCVLARTVSDNRPSIRLLEKLGFCPGHDRPAYFRIGDHSMPLVTYRYCGK